MSEYYSPHYPLSLITWYTLDKIRLSPKCLINLKKMIVSNRSFLVPNVVGPMDECLATELGVNAKQKIDTSIFWRSFPNSESKDEKWK